MNYHTPILLEDILNLFEVKKDQYYLDATVGNGGHTIALLAKGATVYGMDQDENNLEITNKRIEQLNLSKKFIPILGNFSNLKKIFLAKINHPLNGILFDLGLSSNQIKNSNRGFSFNDQDSLDMRLSLNQKINAEFIINTYDFDELYQIFTKFGQERYAKPIILKIIRQRQKQPIKTAVRLADIIRKYYLEHKIKTRLDPSTKIFLALKIAVNNEYNHLKIALEQTVSILKSPSKVCIITFHSTEDRLVKNFIRQHSDKIESLTKKPIKPSILEVNRNPLSRSALLRSYRIR